jgi:hypothetical protein
MLKKIAFFNVPKSDFFGFEIESALARVYCRFAFDVEANRLIFIDRRSQRAT